MHKNGIPNPAMSANAADCGRLWATLTSEYIPDLRIELKLDSSPDGLVAMHLEVVDYCLCSSGGIGVMNVWGKKDFYNTLHLISWGQLFDLLIVSYRSIEDFFEYGEPRAPERREV